MLFRLVKMDGPLALLFDPEFEARNLALRDRSEGAYLAANTYVIVPVLLVLTLVVLFLSKKSIEACPD